MKALIQHFAIVSPFNRKILEWSKMLILTAGGQVLIQALGFINGILIIRMLSTQEYALYTLANSMLGTMIVLADGDIARGVMALGGKVWKDRIKLGIVLSTGFELRKKFAVGSLILAIPVLVYLLRYHGASWVMATLMSLALVPNFLSALASSMLEIAPKLHQDIPAMQKIQIMASAGRLILQALTIVLFPLALVALFVASLAQVGANMQLRKLSLKYADWKQVIDPAIRKKLLNMFMRLLPGAVYYCLSGQITLWLISIWGTTAAVAELGALGRLVMLLNLFNMLFLVLIVPRYARMPNLKNLLLSRFIKILLAGIFLSVGIIAFTAVFSEQVLWVLGSKYSKLGSEVVLGVSASCISLVAGACFTLCISRGWAINPLIYIPVSIISTVCALSIIDVSTLRGALHLNIVLATVNFFIYLIYSISQILGLAVVSEDDGV